MRRGRSRKIEVPTDTQPQVELGDTAEDIEKIIREREGRERREMEERERREMEERDRLETEMIEVTEETEETQDRGEKRPRTDIDPECMQSRQKKGQMKFFFLTDSDEEAIVDFLKLHEELFDKTHEKFKDKQRKERLWETVAASWNLPVSTVKKWFKTQRTRFGKLTQTKSGQAAAKNAERQT